ncbi:MAG: 3-deoxy-D-manno-octulosonic acid transferase [Alphaproteobacteria bacterium]|nr:3-deoxy-D-manno-octulosonic acid transferase [Alphaproteobacteria bacterium]
MLRPQPISAEARAAPGGGFALALYRGLWSALSPAAGLILRARARKGKEDAARLAERMGRSPIARPEGQLVWVHGASVGESLAALPLVSALLEKPGRHILVTTGSVTSAQLMAERLPPRAFHQYAPIDAGAAVTRFLTHWRPDLALFVESELWPNLILETRARNIPMALVNARLSERSYRGWQRARSLAARLLSSFDVCLAQDADVAARLTALGARAVRIAGALKADAPPLPVDETALAAFNAALGGRPFFLAASTHPGEDDALLSVAGALRDSGSNALTGIVPRHPARGREIEALAAARGFSVARRGAGALPSPTTQIYVADTLGELGLFYRAARLAFLGGSLVPHGGQNPLEPARLRTAILTGPHTHNFDEIFATLLAAQGEGRVETNDALIASVLRLIGDPSAATRLGRSAKDAAESLGGALPKTVDIAEALLASHA